MAKKRPFRYSNYRQHKPDLDAPRYERPTLDEGLTGVVQGKPASDLEERLARALYKRRIPFQFQVEVFTRTSMPGEERQVDFVLRGDQPVEPKGQYAHYRDIGQKGKDYLRELQLNEAFTFMGLKPLINIPYWKLANQEMTDAYVRRYL